MDLCPKNRLKRVRRSRLKSLTLQGKVHKYKTQKFQKIATFYSSVPWLLWVRWWTIIPCVAVKKPDRILSESNPKLVSVNVSLTFHYGADILQNEVWAFFQFWTVILSTVKGSRHFSNPRTLKSVLIKYHRNNRYWFWRNKYYRCSGDAKPPEINAQYPQRFKMLEVVSYMIQRILWGWVGKGVKIPGENLNLF